MHLAVQHFWYFVEGRGFIAFTDHKPCTFAFARSRILDPSASSASLRLFRSLRPTSGKLDLVIDALPCPVIAAIHNLASRIDYITLAAA